MIKKFAIILTVTALVSHSAHAICASENEHSSITMRALQSELMVAALSCGLKDNYNNFITLHHDALREHGKMLKTYFKRHYAGKSEYQLNRFVTQLANQASRISLNKADSVYCRQAGLLFQFIEAQDNKNIGHMLNARYQQWHNIDHCKPQQLANR